MGQEQSKPHNKRASIQTQYYDGTAQRKSTLKKTRDDDHDGHDADDDDDDDDQVVADAEDAPIVDNKSISSSHRHRDDDNNNNNNTGHFVNYFQDHYSLGASSTTLRFRSRHLRILDDDRNHQLILEEHVVNTPKIQGSHDNNSNNNRSASSPSRQQQQTRTTTATVKLTSTTNFGMALVRTLFTLPALFIMTCTFCFGVQIILFLYMNIVAVETPDTWNESPPGIAIVGATLAVPLLLYGLGSGMALSWALVVDCWRGLSSEQSMLRHMVFWDPMLTEWICLAVFGGIPLLTMIVTTLMQNDQWYEFTIGSWAIAVLLFQTFYMLLAFLNEMNMCYQLLKRYYHPLVDSSNSSEGRDDDETLTPSLFQRIQTNILLTQRPKYSGVRHERYLVTGNALPPPEGFSSDPLYFPVQYYLKWGSRMTLDDFLGGICGRQTNRYFFDVLDPPQRNYSMEEVFGNVMILSKHNFTLERVWCMDRKGSAAVTLTEGDSSVSNIQMGSGHVCIGVSVVVLVLTLAGLLAWAGQSPVVIFVIIVIVAGFCFAPLLLSSFQVYRFHRNVGKAQQKQADGEEAPLQADSEGPQDPDEPIDEEDPKVTSEEDNTKKDGVSTEDNHDPPTTKAFISVWESVRISEMKPWFCWLTAGLEVVFFFLWPVISLFSTGNIPIGLVFLVMGLPSLMRHYFNASNLLQKIGPIDDLDLTSSMLSPALCGLGGNAASKERWASSMRYEEESKLKNRALVATIIKRVTRSNASGNWIRLFFLLFFIVFAAFIMASTADSFDYKVKGVTFADDFIYETQPDLPYPTCSVQKGFSLPGKDSSAALADYSFLATMSFAAPEEAQPLLDQWFGEGAVVDDFEYVNRYRAATGTANHPVSYKLFTIPSLPDSAIVSIRGSESLWDWTVDVQLWAGGVLAQITEAVNPFGYIWRPILDEFVYVINSVQSDELKRVSYYQYTSAFVTELYAGFDGRQYDNLRVTGASLGGWFGHSNGCHYRCKRHLLVRFERHVFSTDL